MARSYVVEGHKPPLNAFNLSHNHFLTMDFGYVYPVAWFECVPGDVYDFYYQSLIRALALVAPILNNLTVSLDLYFVPSRLLFGNFEKYITTVNGDVIPPQTFEGTQPVWMQDDDGVTFKADLQLDYTNGSIWRCLGFNSLLENPLNLNTATSPYLPLDYLRRAYWFIYNEWYRDENLQMPVDFKNPSKDQSGVNQQRLFKRAWKKDYFTSAFISQQKGTAPSVPITGLGQVQFDFPNMVGVNLQSKVTGLSGVANTTTPSASTPVTINGQGDKSIFADTEQLAYAGIPSEGVDSGVGFLSHYALSGSQVAGEFGDWLSKNNSFNFENAGTFNVADLRDMTAIQRFFEDLMRMGSRYIEFLQGIYGVSPSDARLSIPERIGGADFNLNISEVLQTSETTTTSPQANPAGYANGLTDGKLGAYKCEEFGWILILADIKPPAVYSQRMPREMMRKTLLDMYAPHFVNLSYQEISLGEIFYTGTSEDKKIFAFQGRYDEMREKLSYASGNLVDTQAYYLNQRVFENAPSYNSEFIVCNPNKDIFAVVDEDPFVCNFYFDVKAMRPLPQISEPGLLDHVYGG